MYLVFRMVKICPQKIDKGRQKKNEQKFTQMEVQMSPLNLQQAKAK